jgi:hypothetical protein
MRRNSTCKLHAWPTARSALLRAAATTALIASMAGGMAVMAPAASASSRVPPPKPPPSLVPPLQTVIIPSGSFNVPTISRCPRGSFTGQANGTAATYSFINGHSQLLSMQYSATIINSPTAG